MTKSILRMSLLLFLGVAVVGMPAWSRAQSTNSATRENKEDKPKRSSAPLHGRLKALDASTKTITVGAHTIQITSETKISKHGQPAELSDGVVGEEVSVLYQKSEEGRLEALTVHFGSKDKPHAGSNRTSPGAG